MQNDCTLRLNICNMNSLGFKNFRKFTELKPLELKGITFLVGRNNAGKSTFVKAIILIIEYLKHKYIDEFPIASLSKSDLNFSNFGKIKTFGQKDDTISFEFRFDIYNITLIISGNEYSRIADVIELKITDTIKGYEFEAKPQLQDYYIRYISSIDNKNNRKATENAISEIKARILEVTNETNSMGSIKDYRIIAEKNSTLDGLNSALGIFERRLKEDADNDENNFLINYIIDEIYSIKDTYDNIITIAHDNYDEIINNTSDDAELDDEEYDSNRRSDYSKFYTHHKNLLESFTKFFKIIREIDYKYLDSFSVKQNAVLLIKDKSNALAQAVDDFMTKRIQNGQVPYEFIQRWMNEFEVGQDFEIETIRGEAYVVEISNNRGTLNLADKGMGSIQAMLLLFRLASAIHDAITKKINTILFIEEPELNLHPALQSKLAELFLEVNQKYGIQFVIETHSEYLIRKTQLLVKENEFEIAPNENPFSIIYFHEEDGPYKMNYRKDGKFIEDFGKGFYDESALLTLNLL